MLKAGTVADFDNSLAAAMEQAMKDEWSAVKHVDLPAQGADDRRLLLVAVARGLLTYMKSNQDLLIQGITLKDPAVPGSEAHLTVTQLELNL